MSLSGIKIALAAITGRPAMPRPEFLPSAGSTRSRIGLIVMVYAKKAAMSRRIKKENRPEGKPHQKR